MAAKENEVRKGPGSYSGPRAEIKGGSGKNKRQDMKYRRSGAK